MVTTLMLTSVLTEMSANKGLSLALNALYIKASRYFIKRKSVNTCVNINADTDADTGVDIIEICPYSIRVKLPLLNILNRSSLVFMGSSVIIPPGTASFLL